VGRIVDVTFQFCPEVGRTYAIVSVHRIGMGSTQGTPARRPGWQRGCPRLGPSSMTTVSSRGGRAQQGSMAGGWLAWNSDTIDEGLLVKTLLPTDNGNIRRQQPQK
jgi:hypothetical protein